MDAKEKLMESTKIMVKYILPEDARLDEIINSYSDTFISIAEDYHNSILSDEKEHNNIVCVNNNLLAELRKHYLVEINDDGEPLADIDTILKLWDDVNKYLILNGFN